jgi:hypothetical protein
MILNMEVKMSSIQSRVNNEIYSHVSQTGKGASLIVIHPQTWQDLCIEVIISYCTSINRHDPSLKYKGIRVLRSLDMVEGLVEVR